MIYDLDYSAIFSIFADMISKAMPIAIFLYLTYILISLFFSLAFPKIYRKGE